MSILIIISLIVIVTMSVAYWIEHSKKRWAIVYTYVNNIMWVIHESEEFEEIGFVRDNLVKFYKLSEEEANLCIENWRDKEWFSEQDFLKK